jgi:hypothetical protein
MQPTISDLMDQLHDVTLTGDPLTPITGIAFDSRAVQPGMLFVALRGGYVDGHQFLHAALPSSTSSNRRGLAMSSSWPAKATSAASSMGIRHSPWDDASVARNAIRVTLETAACMEMRA